MFIQIEERFLGMGINKASSFLRGNIKVEDSNHLRTIRKHI
jgi:hypothetical protein